jgi:hypothetical protein
MKLLFLALLVRINRDYNIGAGALKSRWVQRYCNSFDLKDSTSRYDVV